MKYIIAIWREDMHCIKMFIFEDEEKINSFKEFLNDSGIEWAVSEVE